MEITMDKLGAREFVNYHRGMDTYTYRFDTGKLYSVFPVIDTPVCERFFRILSYCDALLVDAEVRSQQARNVCTSVQKGTDLVCSVLRPPLGRFCPL